LATKDSNIYIDLKYFEYLWPYTIWYKENLISKEKYLMLLKEGEIQIETMFENVLAYNSNGKYIKESANGRDFSDGSDAKKTTACFHRGRYDASVTGITTKFGTLRVLMLDSWNDKFYHFKIPYEAYKNLKMIEIQYGKDKPEPQRHTKWWVYEVDNLKELCK